MTAESVQPRRRDRTQCILEEVIQSLGYESLRPVVSRRQRPRYKTGNSHHVTKAGY